jgi:asparagine N-glycosylation enzyme membrane subunit Stt3
MKSNQVDPNTLIKAGVTLAGIYLVYKVLQKVGVIPTAEANQAAQNLQQLQAANYWDYNNFLATAPPGHSLLTQAGAAAYVDDLWDATGTFNDDEEQIYGVFRAMKTKSQVAALAKRFNQLKSFDLYNYLENYLNEEELLKVKGIIDQKPNYFP